MSKYISLLSMMLLAVFTACSEKDDVLSEDDSTVWPFSADAKQPSLVGSYAYSGDAATYCLEVSLFDDGSASFFDFADSSYVGVGRWSSDNGIITIDDGATKNLFKKTDYGLVFVEEGSTNFYYTKIFDGDVFVPKPAQETEYAEDDAVTYVYYGEGFGGPFTITLEKNGQASFYEGYLSSYLGFGTWTQKGNVLVVSDNTYVNKFRVKGDELVFIEDGSTNFSIIKLKNGDRFILRK